MAEPDRRRRRRSSRTAVAQVPAIAAALAAPAAATSRRHQAAPGSARRPRKKQKGAPTADLRSRQRALGCRGTAWPLRSRPDGPGMLPPPPWTTGTARHGRAAGQAGQAEHSHRPCGQRPPTLRGPSPSLVEGAAGRGERYDGKARGPGGARRASYGPSKPRRGAQPGYPSRQNAQPPPPPPLFPFLSLQQSARAPQLGGE